MDSSVATKIATPKKKQFTTAEKTALSEQFWNAHIDTLFDQNAVSVITNHSTSWCENMRWRGGGIPYVKCGHKCLYRKRDVLAWLESYSVLTSTSDTLRGTSHE